MGINLSSMSVSLVIEANSSTTLYTIDNIERSIREFNIERATIEWSGAEALSLRAQATAYYMGESAIEETTVTVSADDSGTASTSNTEEEQ